MISDFEETVKMAPNLFKTVQPHDGYEIFTQIHQVLLLDNVFRGIVRKLFSLKTYRNIPFK